MLCHAYYSTLCPTIIKICGIPISLAYNIHGKLIFVLPSINEGKTYN
jgi:hypothetical protein